MRQILTCLVAFAVLAELNGQQFRCDYRFSTEADGWLKLHRIPASWNDARLRCQIEGSKLASPLNEGLLSEMRSMMEQASLKFGAFTGIHSYFSKGDFVSIEGVPLSDIPHTWAEDQPDPYSDEGNCILMETSGELAYVNCTELMPYFCYRKNTTTVLNDCGTIDNEYTLDSRTGSCYKYHTKPRNWTEAYMACAAEGGHLAIINSETEAQVIREVFDRNTVGSRTGNFWKEAHVGFHDWGESGGLNRFLTVHGQTLEEAGYAKFANGEPNNVTPGEHCGDVYNDGLYNDQWCPRFRPFICEKSPNSLLCKSDDQKPLKLQLY